MTHTTGECRSSAIETLAALKELKNTAVGNAAAKSAIVGDGRSLYWMLEWLGDLAPEDEELREVIQVRLEIARIIGTLANCNAETSLALVRARTIQVLLHTLSGLANHPDAALEAAVCNSLRAIATSCSAIVGSMDWGLPRNHSVAQREEARKAVELLLQADALNAYLPRLAGTEATAAAVAGLIYQVLSCWDSPGPRKAITQWTLPIESSHRTPGEPPSGQVLDSEFGSRTVARLVERLPLGNAKSQEAVLMALASLTQDNPVLASSLMRLRSAGKKNAVFSDILNLMASDASSVKWAAAFCAVRILRAMKDPAQVTAMRPNQTTFNPVLALVFLINNVIEMSSIDSDLRMRYCFILAVLTADDNKIQETVGQCRSLPLLLRILVESAPPKDTDFDFDEVPRVVSRLREAALLALASTTLLSDTNRREALEMAPSYISVIMDALDDPTPGIRYAACQCCRALSRSVDVLKTSVPDSGLGVKIWELLKRENDVQIQVAALMCIANLLLDFSPLREVLFNDGVITRIVELIDTGDLSIQLNAAWALRNALYRASSEDYSRVMEAMGKERFVKLVTVADPKIRRQGMILIRNAASPDPCLRSLIHHLGEDTLLSILEGALNDGDDEICANGAFALPNLARLLSEDQIVNRRALILAIKNKLRSRNRNAEFVKAILTTITILAKSSDHAMRVLKEQGLDLAVKDAFRDFDCINFGSGPIDTIQLREIGRSAVEAFAKQ